MRRKVARFNVAAEFGVAGGNGNDSIVACAGIDHGHEANGARFDEGERLHRLLAENEYIEWIVVLGVLLGNEAVVCGIEDCGMDDAIHFQQATGFVQFVLDVGTERDFDDRLKIAGKFISWRNVMPGVEHQGTSFIMGIMDCYNLLSLESACRPKA